MCIEIDELLDSPALEPGSLLKSLASMAQCRLFFTLGFDPLMERALNLLRGAGRPITRTWCFSLDRESVDLPNPAASRAPGRCRSRLRIVEKLRAAGCLVWLDDDRLICGDDFESNLEFPARRAVVADFSFPSSPARPRAGASRTTTRSATGQPNASSP